MAYGREQYGQQPYGGSGFDGTGPSLVSTSPAAGDRNVPLDADVSFVLTSSGGFDPWALVVHLDNQPAIVGGAAQEPTFRASIVYDGDLCTVTITLHPDFTDSSFVSLQIWATDLSGVESEFIIDFHDVFLAGVAETITGAEAVSTQQAGLLAVSESPSLAESVGFQHAAPVPVAETVSAAEALGTILGLTQGVSETVTKAEALGTLQEGQLPVVEAVSLAEAVDPVKGMYTPLAESVLVSEAEGHFVGVRPVVSETVSISEATGLQQAGQLPVAEAITNAEAVAALRASYADVVEAVPVAASLATAAGFLVDLADTVPVVEATAPLYNAKPFLAETLALLETIDVLVQIILHETVFLNETAGPRLDRMLAALITVVLTESADASAYAERDVAETVALAENVVVPCPHQRPHVSETVVIEESLTVGQEGINPYDRTIRIRFPGAMGLQGLLDLESYNIVPLRGAFPVAIEAVMPLTTTVQTGTGTVDRSTPTGSIVVLTSYSSPPVVGDYFVLGSGEIARITHAFGPPLISMRVALDRSLAPYASLDWSEVVFTGVELTVSRGQDDGSYRLDAWSLETAAGDPADFSQEYMAVVPKPRLSSVEFLDEGQVVLTFSEDMRPDPALTSPLEYSFTGPSTVDVQRVETLGPRQIALHTYGMQAGDYTLEVNATGTPKDLAGNPIDPVYNTAAFTGAVPLTVRSVFTDKGPISKPPLTLQTGATASVTTFTEVALPTVVLSPSLVGKYLTIGGTTNNGTYRISAIIPVSGLNPPKVRVQASFTLPDAGPLNWEIFDPRDGQIADDPSDVVVRVNNLPVTPEAVLGLLGQIVLPTRPPAGADVKADYSFVRNPEVEIRRLNSKEFRLNNWNRDNGRPADATAHKYRFNNVLPVPTNFALSPEFQQGINSSAITAARIELGDGDLSGYVGHNAGLVIRIFSGPNAGIYDITMVPDATHVDVSGVLTVWATSVAWAVSEAPDFQARLAQPLQRDLKYRAYERAYTPVLNDPNLLVLNSPNHRIAFPPLERPVSAVFVSYDALVLPEASSPPWARHGAGTATLDNGELVVQDTAGGPFPTGEPVFWFRPQDATFPHVLAATWRMRITADPVTEGVFTGVCMGFSGETRACVIGCLDVGGTRQIGILKLGYGNDPSLVTAWTGGVDSTLNPTGLPADFDWSVEHSYRLFRALDGTVRVYVDGEVVEILRVLEDELPFLEELNAPFDALEGVWWGSLSRPALNTSRWTFVRYEVLPTNPMQVAPSLYVSYEGTTAPEDASEPWTPIGYHGTETIVSGNLVLDSTSATDATTEAEVGLVGGDFRGYMKLEPLLSASTENLLDVNVQLRTWTHGITNNAVTAAIDDGDRLIQLSFFPDKAAPKFSYGGRSLPDEWTPLPWTKTLVGTTATATMLGRTLRIADPDVLGGLVYDILDTAPEGSDGRVSAASGEYILEFRLQVQSYTPDPAGYCGAQATAFDGTRAVGLMLEEILGVRYVTLHSDGIPVAGGRFVFDWFDGLPHTFRVTKRGVGGPATVSVFVDTVYFGGVAYTAMVPLPGLQVWGDIAFGSSTPVSNMAISTVDWMYCNTWRVFASCRKYVGIWNGKETDSLLGYHLPLKTSGTGTTGDVTMAVEVLPASVVVGDLLIIDEGTNRGVYEISSITGPRTGVGLTTSFPAPTQQVGYRIAQEIDWTTAHKYRVIKDPGDMVTVMLDSDPIPLFQFSYDQLRLPSRTAGIFMAVANTLPSISFGAFDPTNLSQTGWDYVRFGITRSPTEMRIAPHHQVLNQRNVMASYEHVRTTIPHSHTDYWSSSTGIPPQKDPDFLHNPALTAYTLLNAGTPLMPSTQTAEVRAAGGDIYPIQQTVSGLNRPEDVLNADRDFVLNDGAFRWTLHVPDDVLYNSLEVVETQVGSEQIYPFDDESQPDFGTIYYQDQVCLRYTGDVLPEFDTSSAIPWVFEAGDDTHVQRSIFASVLTFGTDPTGTWAIYRNPTPLPDSASLQTEARFRLRLAADSSGGLGDTQVRFGLSAPGYTMALAFVTIPTGERYVLIKDLNANTVVGGMPFDFSDGLFHTYRIVRDIGSASVQVFIDS